MINIGIQLMSDINKMKTFHYKKITELRDIADLIIQNSMIMEQDILLMSQLESSL